MLFDNVQYFSTSYFSYCCSTSTVWKFHDFSITQILREINFGASRSSETPVFAILGALDFVTLANFKIQKVQKSMKIKIQCL